MAIKPTLDADLTNLLERVATHLVATASQSPNTGVALLADTRLMQERLTKSTAPDTNRSIDTWHKNLFECLATVRERIVRSGAAFAEGSDGSDEIRESALMVVELMKARTEAATLLGILDAMITTYLPDDPTDAECER